MSQLVLECEEEDLEPWQKRVEESNDEDDDELIFVREISGSRPAISHILNRGNSSSSSKRVKDDALDPGIPAIFRSANQCYKDSTSSPVAALPRFSPGSKSSQSSAVQNESKPDFTKNSSQVGLDDSSGLLFDLTQDTISLSPKPTTFTEGKDQTLPVSKCPSTSKVSSVDSEDSKTYEDVFEISSSGSLSLVNSPSLTSSQYVLSQGTNTSTQYKTGVAFLKPCPKCNVHFDLLDPLKYHMKHCCPDMANNYLESVKAELSYAEYKNKTGSEKEKLVMLVNDFYYGRHEGAFGEEEKTYTTFKCFSCLKVLKNNIRFMNHMKHHLEHEKQDSESWENHTTCQHCYRQYTTPFQLQCHIESTHTPHGFSTICKICELSFSTERVLLQHMKDTHKPGEMPYVCQVCQFRSSAFSDVEVHFRAFHENTKNLLCPFCLKVSRMATPYMNHYMKHQNKGIHHCTKCRLQFLTFKEKVDHSTQHRTFIKPKELEGLPPGTRVTIRTSHASSQSSSSSSSCSPGTSLQVSPPDSSNTIAKNFTKSYASKYKASVSQESVSVASKPNTSMPSPGGTSKNRAKPSYKQKRQRNRKSKISMALRNLRCHQGIHKCIECHSKIKDFASHFSVFIHCDFCKYNTNCNKAFVNHMMSSHSNHPSKRFCIFKKQSEALRGITLVCLKCDFLSDSSGLDRMAKHLSQRKTHTCQVIIENVSKSTSTTEPTSDDLSE
ncbi:zinc finger protein 280C [Cynocephalus volans]|uniref:zinc finger protein 280C n=1 Tax=Cynocephalus volans TaxID=110931 RepID=UPI002FC61A2F